jgi:hypothetical protein
MISRTTRRAIGVIAVVLLDTGLVLTQLTSRGGTLSQWNGRCEHRTQALTLSAQDCALASRADHATGWLIGEGLVLLAAYAILRLTRWTRQPAPRVPGR